MSVWRSRRWPRALATLVPSGCAGFFSFENGVTVVGASGQRKNGAKTVAVFQKKRRRMEGGGLGVVGSCSSGPTLFHGVLFCLQRGYLVVYRVSSAN